MSLRPLLILQTGNAPRAVSAEHGGFDAMVQAQANLAPGRTTVVKVYAGQALADPTHYAAAIITGSPANVTDRDAWSVATADWLRRAVAEGLPILGICYGHQLLAEALGGRVDFNPGGRESGTQRVHGTADAASDPLAMALPSSFPAHFIHEQSVTALPPGAIVLARNGHDAHQMLRFAPHVWGVQFHPEFDAAIMRTYIAVMGERLAAEGADVAALASGVIETPAANTVLRAFVARYVGMPGAARPGEAPATACVAAPAVGLSAEPPAEPPAAAQAFAATAVRRVTSAPGDPPRPLHLQRNPAGTEAEIAALVHAFYERVRADAELGPIFAAHVHDWDMHLAHLCDFWSSLLRGTTRFRGSPMQKHAAVPGLTDALFERWLGLFRDTCATLPNRVLAERATVLAGRVARSLWMGYQLQHLPDEPARDLQRG